MHDINIIRSNPQLFDAACQKRGLEAQSNPILAHDEARRALLTEQSELQAQRNTLAKEIGLKKKSGEDADELMEQSKTINARLKDIDEILPKAQSALDELLLSLPNILLDDVPDGSDESGNIEIKQHGSKPAFAFTPKHHFELGESLKQMDFELAAKMSGSRFVLLRKSLARLERALANFMLDTHTQGFGYEEIVPPLLVRSSAMQGTGQLPKFAEDSYRVGDDHWLISTSEIPLTNIVAETIIDPATLPLRFCAYTPCFRSEAGSAGRDTRGMIRQHQFSKVELVSIVEPEQGELELERKLGAAESILQQLGLHYRVMLLCAGDTGFSARKTYDIEVWLPGQNAYREISSVSYCGEFQARRMKARYKPQGSKQTQMVHTLNGSGLAIGRTMVALLENYQREDGSIAIPLALQPYMGGLQEIIAAS